MKVLTRSTVSQKPDQATAPDEGLVMSVQQHLMEGLMTDKDPERVGFKPPTRALVFFGVCFVLILIVSGALAAIADGHNSFARWFLLVMSLWGLAVSTHISLKEVL